VNDVLRQLLAEAGLASLGGGIDLIVENAFNRRLFIRWSTLTAQLRLSLTKSCLSSR